jgi:uncharacterized membrane protein
MSNKVTKSIIVKRPVAELFQLWANFENFPHFMENIHSVQKTGDRTSHWAMEGPLGTKVEWDAETTLFEENKRIAWNSKDRSALTTSGQVAFNALPNNETEVTVMMHYDPPAGMAGELVAKFFGNPEKRVEEDLNNFKHYAEGRVERTAAGKSAGEQSRK